MSEATSQVPVKAIKVNKSVNCVKSRSGRTTTTSEPRPIKGEINRLEVFFFFFFKKKKGNRRIGSVRLKGKGIGSRGQYSEVGKVNKETKRGPG